MRAFVFAIGGTGSRVLTSMIMQFAAGMRPIIDKETKEPIKNLTIVPIIVDPHVQNAACIDVVELLNNYRTLWNKIHPDGNLNASGFFGVKISTLAEISTQEKIADRFFFKMEEVSNNGFKDYISLSDMESANKMFSSMLFSQEELETHMSEGFYGSPNIGTVALNEFKNSDDFKVFQSAFNDGDRLFFIGSIFGGTGAAGLPLFITSIRDLSHKKNVLQGRTLSAKAPIGALIVMPYFAIEHKDNAKIDENDFTIKTKSALRYYEDNLNKYVNSIYYINDAQNRTIAFVNDPGDENNQKKNKAHIVEFIGATALCDFLSTPQNELEVTEDDNNRNVATKTLFKQYTLNDDKENNISFRELAHGTNDLLMLPMMKFYLLNYYMNYHYAKNLKAPYASDYDPKLQNSVFSEELRRMFEFFNRWMSEMRNHGDSAHNLDLFNWDNNSKFTNSFKGVKPQERRIGSKNLTERDIIKALNKEAQKNCPFSTAEERWFTIVNEALEKVITENLDIANF